MKVINLLVFICFILLNTLACGGGSPAVPSPVEQTEPSQKDISPDLTQLKLLSDEELITPELPYQLIADEDATQWMKDNYFPIRSIVYDKDFSDLQFLEPLIAGKRIVQLGESSHTSSVFNHMKVRMIKYLHQELGFNVIAFESSLMGCYQLNKEISDVPASTLTQSCIFGVWHTEEVVELFDYMKQTQATDRPLKLIGFDTQLSGYYDYRNTNYIETYWDFIQPVVDSINPTDGMMVKSWTNAIFDFYNQSDECFAQYDQAICSQWLTTLSDTLQQADLLTDYFQTWKNYNNGNPALELDTKLVNILASSLKQQILGLNDYYTSPIFHQYGFRDVGMAANVSKIANEIYPDDKIILWAHNGHIEMDYSDDLAREGNDHSMGYHLKQEWGEQLYTIGFFMIRGKISNRNHIGSLSVVPHNSNSLEAIAYQLRQAALFMPISANQTTTTDDWLHQLIETNVEAVDHETKILSLSFDGFIVIDTSTEITSIGY